MVNSKKLLSLFLAVVMVLSSFVVMASAYTRVETEGTADIDVKYTVEKVAEIPDTDAGSVALAGDNFYAVTVWMKSSKGIDILAVPFHYNKTLFSPITLSDGDCTYPYGAGLDQDSYYSDMGEGTNYLYSLGDYMNNTGMYTATGATAKTQALAKCIGLGNANSAGVTVTTELVSPDHPLYNKWGAGLPANTGVMYAQLNVNGKAKTAYLNTIEGITTSTDWNRMLTVYFEAIADDVSGAEFGVFTDDCFTVDGNYDATGSSYFKGATSYKAAVPTMNVTANAVVEAAATPELVLAQLKQQIRFPENKETFDYRVFANITNLEEIFKDVAGVNDKSDNTYMTEAGFIYNMGAAIDQSVALTQINGGEAVYLQQKHAYISTSTGLADYAMACVIYDIPYDAANETVSVLAYVKYVQDGEAKVALVDAYTGTFEPLFTNNKPTA